MRIFPLLALGVCASLAWAQPNDAPTTIKTGTLPPPPPAKQIETAVRSFAEALNGKYIYFGAVGFVFDAKIGYYGGPEWGEDWEKQRGNSRLIIERFEAKVEGETATAQVFYRWQTPLFRSELLEERLNLRFAKARFGPALTWKIVPPVIDEKAASHLLTASPPFLNNAARVIANPQPLVSAARAGASLSNLKQLSLAASKFIQNYDQIYAFAPEYAEKALAPHLFRTPQIWKVPERDEKYSFNANLSEKNVNQVVKPVQTVLFYEGINETPIFRYDGRAAIGFVDGHVALVSPEDAKNLIWRP